MDPQKYPTHPSGKHVTVALRGALNPLHLVWRKQDLFHGWKHILERHQKEGRNQIADTWGCSVDGFLLLILSIAWPQEKLNKMSQLSLPGWTRTTAGFVAEEAPQAPLPECLQSTLYPSLDFSS